MSTQVSFPDFLTLEEVRTALGFEEFKRPEYLKKKVKALGIPYYEFGRTWRVDRLDLLEWIEKQRRCRTRVERFPRRRAGRR